MTPKIKPSIALAILGLTLAGVASASATTFTDSFDVGGNTNNINASIAGSRQTGVPGGVSYIEAASTGAGGSADNGTQLGNINAPGPSTNASLLLAAFNGVDVRVTPNIDVAPTPTGSATVSFGVDPLGKGGTNGIDQLDWAAVVFGATGTDQGVAGSNGIGLLLRGNGDFQLFDAGNAVAAGSYGKLGSPSAEVYQTVIATMTNTSNGGVVSISVNGNPIMLGNSSTYTRSAQFTNNYVTLSAQGVNTGVNNQSFFNNLRISNDSAAPEPSQIAGLGFAGFGLLGLLLKARRSRVTAK